MPLTNATHFTTAQTRSVIENWLFEIDDSAGGVLRLAYADTTVGGNQYAGAVLNEPSIRTSIDLAKSSAGTGNLSLEVANFVLAGVPLSEKLVFGSTKYLNRECRVYIQLNEQATLANCLRVYTGRLTSVSHELGSIKLEFEEARPWDFIKIPNVQAPSGKYFPLVYGDYSYNTSTPTTPAYCNSKALWPAQVDVVNNEVSYCLMDRNRSTSTANRPHIYESSMDRFVPIVDNTGTFPSAVEAVGDGYQIGVPKELIHAVKFKPTALAANSSYPNTFTDAENSFDDPEADESSTYATATVTSGVAEFYLQTPTCDLDVYHTVDEETKFIIVTKLYFSRSGVPNPTLWISVDGGSTFIGQYQPSATGDVNVTWTIDSTELPGGVLPSQIGFYFFVFGGSTSVTCRIYDIRFSVISRTSMLVDPGSATEQDRANNERRANDQRKQIREFYFGNDGPDKSWDSGVVTDIHDMHRDILYRYGGYTGTPTGWSALDTARSGWTARWWTHDPVQLKDVLELAQYEGCFIFLWDADGTGKYIFVADSYSSGDVTATLGQGDIAKVSVSHTDFGGLVTKKSIQYDRHPATGDYQSSYAYENSTARTAYNIQTEENIEQVELEMLVAEVDEHAAYYGNINGDIKCVVRCEVLDPVRSNLTVGDIVQFDAAGMPFKAFADAWTQYFMITECVRGKGVLKITCVEVG